MPTTRFKVAITGDSILQLGCQLLYGWERYVDTESGRNPYQKGLENRMSSNEAFQRLIPLIAEDGYFVFQDNGAVATQAQWRTLLQAVVNWMPDEATLIGVLPVWMWSGNCSNSTSPETAFLDTAAKAQIMVDEFEEHPNHDWIRWSQLVRDAPDPTVWVTDGQHPTQAGQEWLAAEVSEVTGTTAGPPA